MSDEVTKKLDEANKLIFIKEYERAARLLEKVSRQKDGKKNLLVHLRRIELATRLNSIEEVRDQYIREIDRNDLDPSIGKLCVALAEQHGEMVSPIESIQRFNDIMSESGESAAGYFGIALSLENQGNYERAIYNYQQSLVKDVGWYPSYFGLSQIFYSKNDHEQGDHYFYLFEKHAPFNLYGNFETHRILAQEFLDNHQFVEAEASIMSLSEWWIDNKGTCPIEIQINEALALANIASLRGDSSAVESRRERATMLCKTALNDARTTVDTLYFIAKLFEDNREPTVSLEIYRQVLSRQGNNPSLVQQIGGHFLSTGQFTTARELFQEAYLNSPDNNDIRFCYLVSNLRIAGIDVESYLARREQALTAAQSDKGPEEAIAILLSLRRDFADDVDVHTQLGDLYIQRGDIPAAGKAFNDMYKIGHLNAKTALRFASFAVSYGDLERAKDILERIQRTKPDLELKDRLEILWLLSNYHARKETYDKALEGVSKALAEDPWNVSYIIHDIICRTHVRYGDQYKTNAIDLAAFLSDGEKTIDWESFDRTTAKIQQDHHYDLVYARSKLHFLFVSGDPEALHKLIDAARHFNAKQGMHELIRLINTNFDSPHIYYGLALLSKDLWQLETATMWLEQMIMRNTDLSHAMKSKVYVELADCYVWRRVESEKSIEYAKIALEMDPKVQNEALIVLAQGYLRSGKIREAQYCLEGIDRKIYPFESTYLDGLLNYRNGLPKVAKQLWKPLLTHRSENMRLHHIKQEIMRYYFDGDSYLKVV